MIKILRYLLAILFIAFIIFTLKNKTTRLKVLKIIFSVFMALIIIIMPFENLILKFDSPEQAFKYVLQSRKYRVFVSSICPLMELNAGIMGTV